MSKLCVIYTLAVDNLDPILFDYLWLGSLLRELDCDSGIDTRRSVNRQCRHPSVLCGRDETMVSSLGVSEVSEQANK